MKKHSDYITHIKNEEDKVYLRSKLLPVNIRLFNTSPEYKAIILQQCDYLKMLVLTKMEGYKKPHGMSSANAGLAFNIIAICMNRGQKDEQAVVMINPRIVDLGKDLVETTTNCGSLTLEEPIKIERPDWCVVEWWAEDGSYCVRDFHREDGAFTIQHEIDHNLGILIIDYL